MQCDIVVLKGVKNQIVWMRGSNIGERMCYHLMRIHTPSLSFSVLRVTIPLPLPYCLRLCLIWKTLSRPRNKTRRCVLGCCALWFWCYNDIFNFTSSHWIMLRKIVSSLADELFAVHWFVSLPSGWLWAAHRSHVWTPVQRRKCKRAPPFVHNATPVLA